MKARPGPLAAKIVRPAEPKTRPPNEPAERVRCSPARPPGQLVAVFSWPVGSLSSIKLRGQFSTKTTSLWASHAHRWLFTNDDDDESRPPYLRSALLFLANRVPSPSPSRVGEISSRAAVLEWTRPSEVAQRENEIKPTCCQQWRETLPGRPVPRLLACLRALESREALSQLASSYFLARFRDSRAARKKCCGLTNVISEPGIAPRQAQVPGLGPGRKGEAAAAAAATGPAACLRVAPLWRPPAATCRERLTSRGLAPPGEPAQLLGGPAAATAATAGGTSRVDRPELHSKADYPPTDPLRLLDHGHKLGRPDRPARPEPDAREPGRAHRRGNPVARHVERLEAGRPPDQRERVPRLDRRVHPGVRLDALALGDRRRPRPHGCGRTLSAFGRNTWPEVADRALGVREQLGGRLQFLGRALARGPVRDRPAGEAAPRLRKWPGPHAFALVVVIAGKPRSGLVLAPARDQRGRKSATGSGPSAATCSEQQPQPVAVARAATGGPQRPQGGLLRVRPRRRRFHHNRRGPPGPQVARRDLEPAGAQPGVQQVQPGPPGRGPSVTDLGPEAGQVEQESGRGRSRSRSGIGGPEPADQHRRLCAVAPVRGRVALEQEQEEAKVRTPAKLRAQPAACRLLLATRQQVVLVSRKLAGRTTRESRVHEHAKSWLIAQQQVAASGRREASALELQT
ncbi:Hypothetical predicted protein [Olea europaea subsp. europaea]|uniref:Uncharacterized protein n=1 Tax=Olea europaea subsp. europaea TaxID=158383 RepID=A0A8S0TKQ0_OLEEU|nr:Hypothetical predicted protein [Olea europaea subsp. europaea]